MTGFKKINLQVNFVRQKSFFAIQSPFGANQPRAWHTGAELEPVADLIRKMGDTVHCPTLAGNRRGDNHATSGLKDAIDSLVNFLTSHDLKTCA